jgi:hypothetical protein
MTHLFRKKEYIRGFVDEGIIVEWNDVLKGLRILPEENERGTTIFCI